MRKIFILFFLNLLLTVLFAQKPMTLNELKPKIDSINSEQKKLTHTYLIYQYLKTQTNKNSKVDTTDYFTYARKDTIFGLILTKAKRVIVEYQFLSNQNTPFKTLNNYRSLTSKEDSVYQIQHKLVNKVFQNIKDSTLKVLKLFLFNENTIKLYVITSDSNENKLPITNNYLLIKNEDKNINTKHYHPNNNDPKIIDERKDTLNDFLVICDYPDPYISAIDIFVFKHFAPNWWITGIYAYSRRNKRYFIYNKETDEIQIKKHSFEK